MRDEEEIVVPEMTMVTMGIFGRALCLYVVDVFRLSDTKFSTYPQLFLPELPFPISMN